MLKDVVLIEWVDSYREVGWENIEGLKPIPPDTCVSVGFLIEDHADYKTIAVGLGATMVLGRTTTPTGCIKSMKFLTTS
jgi:hypothetical protein